MPTQNPTPTRARTLCNRVALTCGCVSVVVAAVVLNAWALNRPGIASIVPGFATMKPNTAMCFALVGSGLVLRAARLSRGLDALGRALAVGAFLIAGLTLQQYWLRVDLGIDTVMWPSGTPHPDVAQPGRMAPATALAHTLLALGVALLARGPARFQASELLAVSAATIGLTATLGYIFGANQLYHFRPFSSLAIPTALLFIIVSIGILAASEHHHSIRTLTSPYLGGRVSRRILCYAVIGPVLINWLAVRARTAGLYEQEVTVAVTTVVAILATALVALAAGSWINRADEQRQTIARQQAAMMRELDHRVKNNLASVLALTSLTIDNARSLDDFRDAFVGRIRALARTHEALAASRWEGVRLLDVIRLTIGPYAGQRRSSRGADATPETSSGERLIIDGPDVMLPAVVSSSVCASLHELATNAAKYGAFNVPGGQVRLRWSVTPDGQLDLEWRELGVASIARPQRTGFGTEMITGAVEHEMQGSVSFEYAPPGLTCRIRAPMHLVRTSLKSEPLRPVHRVA